jgi:hypothetical protein
VRRLGRLSWIAFLGGSCLLGLAVLTSMLRLVPDLLSTVAAILGVASTGFTVLFAYGNS